MKRDYVASSEWQPMTQNAKPESDEPGQEALIVHLQMSDSKFGAVDERQNLFKLEDEIIELMDKTSEGEYDGNEIGEGVLTMYIYGASADRLWALISPILKSFDSLPGSFALKRFGPPGAMEQKITLV